MIILRFILAIRTKYKKDGQFITSLKERVSLSTFKKGFYEFIENLNNPHDKSIIHQLNIPIQYKKRNTQLCIPKEII